MQILYKTLRAIFLGTARAPGPAENRLYDALSAISPLRQSLVEKMLPMLESEDFRKKYPSRDPAKAWALQEQDITTWSFYLLLHDRLQQKNWPVYPQAGQDNDLCYVFGILEAQMDVNRINFDMLVQAYKSRENPRYRKALQFLLDHAGDLEQVLADLKDFKPEDIQPRHRAIFPGIHRGPLPPQP